MYIADSGNHRIRKVTTRYLTTISANISLFTYHSSSSSTVTSVPTVVPTTASPTLIPTTASPTIIPTTASPTVVPTSGVTEYTITTIAGTGTQSYGGDGGQATSAAMSFPHGLALDSTGNVYIADYYNNRIRKVTVSTGIISLIAGTGTQSYSGDGGHATSATMYHPIAVALDASGRNKTVYIFFDLY